MEDVNAPTPNGWTPIQMAARYGHTVIFMLLASKVENANAPVNGGGWTPLHCAAEDGYTKIVEILASKVDNPNAIAPNGKTPLQLAIENNKFETARKLLEILNKKVDSNLEEILKTFKK